MKVKIIKNIYNNDNIKSIKNTDISENKEIDLVLLNGIGDVIYTYYKLVNLINNGYNINIHSTNSYPQRAHQIQPVLKGIKSFKYIDGLVQSKYRMIDPIDLLDPDPKSLFNGMPVLHINSFLEHGIHINKYLSKYPAIYDIDLNTPEKSHIFAENNINNDYFNIFLYCSNYNNNRNCKMHPDPKFWVKLCELIHSWRGSTKPLKINIGGADYDSDLTNDVYEFLQRKKIESTRYINSNFEDMIELIRNSDFCCCYESGIGMVSDVVKTPCLEIFRYQGPPRDDKLFPFLGAINPESFGNRFFPMFYDDSLEDISKKLDLI